MNSGKSKIKIPPHQPQPNIYIPNTPGIKQK